MNEETPYEVARRLHAQGVAVAEVERTLRSMGLDEVDARIAARAGRGEVGTASPVVVDVATASSLPLNPPEEKPTHPCPVHPDWPVAATCGRCGKFFCAQCVREAGLTAMPESGQCPACEKLAPPKELVGISGWLLLPALQLITTPISLVGTLVQDIRGMSNPVIAAPLMVEAIATVLLISYSLITAVHFFQRKKRAVPMMLGLYAATIGFTVLGAMLVAWVENIVGKSSEVDSTSTRGLTSSVVWIVYFLQSKRVKNTFTR